MHLLNPINTQPQWILTVLLVIFLVEVWEYLTLAYRSYVLKAKPATVGFCIVMAAANHFVMNCVIWAQPGDYPGRPGEEIKVAFNNLPLLSIIIGTALSLMIMAYLLSRSAYLAKNSIFAGSIKRSLDTLPSGICFYYDNGLIKLINSTMLDILEKGMGGVTPKNGNKLKDELIIGKAGPEPLSLGKFPVYKLSDGRLFAFTFSDIEVEGNMAHEIIAVDVSEIYSINMKIEEENAARAEANKKLRNLDETITNVTIQREELEAKIRIHDNLGQAGLMARRCLEKGYNETEKANLLALWRDNINFLKAEKAPDSARVTKISRIIKTAEDVGVILEIEGELPEGEAENNILADAMHECLTNTIRHGGGDRMKVIIAGDRRRVRFVITNNGTPPKEEIKETGGLGNLRREVEGAKGSMKIISSPGFKLIIELNLMRRAERT
ncbi:MAG: hypothetical protein E7241_08395 [Lachnospiraceae bacterium]|nr:hypothetical protein [Lachnospiraceae bacterium]